MKYVIENVSDVREIVTETNILKKDVCEMQEHFGKVKKNIDEMKAYVSKVDETVGEIRENVDDMQENFVEMKETVTKMEGNVGEMKDEIKDVKKRQDAAEKCREVDIFKQADEEKYQQLKTHLKDDLIKYYKWKHSRVPLSPLFEEKDTSLADFYMRPEFKLVVSNSTGGKDQKTPIKVLSNMFNNREIYVTADAGFGKTTFSKYLATLWSEAHCQDKKDQTSFENDDKDCMFKFEYVFLILLRDSYDLCSIDDFLFKQIISNLDHSKQFTEDFLQEIMHNENCLVILDGLDEWTHPDKCCYREPKSIPHRSIREKCTVLTTTRPWKLGFLNLNSNELGIKVELSKLGGDSVNTLSKRTLQLLKSPPNEMSLRNELHLFNKEIERRDITDLAFVPLLLMYIICLYCDGVQIGSSRCELYADIIELLLSKTIQKHRDCQLPVHPYTGEIPQCFEGHFHCKTNYTLLIALGKLAYYSFFNETKEKTLVFEGSIAEKYLEPEYIKLCLISGILTESKTRTLTKQISKESFSHKTVQEFFVAIFIISQSELQKTVLEKCEKVQSILDISTICQFIGKLNPTIMCEISEGFMFVINDDEETREYRSRTDVKYMHYHTLYNIQNMLLSCFKEMTESKHTQLCLQDVFISCDNVHNEHLQCLAKLNRTNIKSLDINGNNTSCSLCEVIDLFSL
ncbi:uncharacterized protein LOC132757409 [Ruditapes philippinarum]|uniref:uncharacterized protein LOC132757409 n=1 Tax=Ruditapes philippinarum TaxID=129788 RepID=UPI00295BB5C1|nr:uncharacterized protein LOC132757409 [Ruditapes philippinarum]XP_060604665.1 uncharacterized protein LOC132757409 [Ruditapes philippinarum]